MKIKPVEGRDVPDPERGGLFPPEGRNVEPTNYWLRRLADGDVVEVTVESAEPSVEPAPATRRSRQEEA